LADGKHVEGREAIYKNMTSQDPQHYDLPLHGIDRKLDQKVKLLIQRKRGIKRVSLL